MDWTTRLSEAVGYMEDRLDGALDIERAAELANCSLFHFCRMFEVVFGVSPAEYVRRRRLSRAALDLAAGGDRVIDVAYRYGWDSPESFAKSFKRCFGITPSEARGRQVTLETWPPIRLAVILKGDASMKYRIVEKEAFEFVGVSFRTTQADNENMKSIPKFWGTCSEKGIVGALASHAGPLGMVGVCHDYRPSDNSFAYGVVIERPSCATEELPAECEPIRVPAATYAVFESIGPMPDAIQETWRGIYSEWFPASAYEHAGTPDFESYPEQARPDIDDSSPEYRTEVWIPIKKKGARP